MRLVENIEHDKPNKQVVLKEFVDIEKFTVLNSLLVEKSIFY